MCITACSNSTTTAPSYRMGPVSTKEFQVAAYNFTEVLFLNLLLFLESPLHLEIHILLIEPLLSIQILLINALVRIFKNSRTV